MVQHIEFCVVCGSLFKRPSMVKNETVKNK